MPLPAAVGIKKEDVTVNVTLLGGGIRRKSFPDFIVEAAVLSKKQESRSRLSGAVKTTSSSIRSTQSRRCISRPHSGPTENRQRGCSAACFPPIASTFEATEYADAGEIGLGFSDVPFALANHRAEENGPAPAHTRIGCCARSPTFITRSAYILLSVNWPAPRAKIKWTTSWRSSAPIASSRKLNCRRITRITMAITNSTQSTLPDFAAWCSWRLKKSGWGKQKLGNGLGMGIAVHRSFLTYVATVVQAEVKDGQVKIHRVDSALDAGTIVNPTTIRQQFEGAAAMGTSIAMYGEITATNGVIDQSNFDSFQVARMSVAPRETNVHIVASRSAAGGDRRAGLASVCARALQRDLHGYGETPEGDAVVETRVGVSGSD